MCIVVTRLFSSDPHCFATRVFSRHAHRLWSSYSRLWWSEMTNLYNVLCHQKLRGEDFTSTTLLMHCPTLMQPKDIANRGLCLYYNFFILSVLLILCAEESLFLLCWVVEGRVLAHRARRSTPNQPTNNFSMPTAPLAFLCRPLKFHI